LKAVTTGIVLIFLMLLGGWFFVISIIGMEPADTIRCIVWAILIVLAVMCLHLISLAKHNAPLCSKEMRFTLVFFLINIPVSIDHVLRIVNPNAADQAVTWQSYPSLSILTALCAMAAMTILYQSAIDFHGWELRHSVAKSVHPGLWIALYLVIAPRIAPLIWASIPLGDFMAMSAMILISYLMWLHGLRFRQTTA
jgi:hypothetical protein